MKAHVIREHENQSLLTDFGPPPMDPNKGPDPHPTTAWSLQRDVLTDLRTLQDMDAECQYGFESSNNVRRRSHFQVVQGILVRDTSPEPCKEPVKRSINTWRWLRAREVWESARSDTTEGERKNLMSELIDATLALRPHPQLANAPVPFPCFCRQ